jgi:hypothetical protein
MKRDTIIDELIEMAEGLICLGSGPDPGKVIFRRDGKVLGVVPAPIYDPPIPCPHCKMLKRLRELKTEQEHKS